MATSRISFPAKLVSWISRIQARAEANPFPHCPGRKETLMTEPSRRTQNVLGIVHTAIAVSDVQHQIDFWQQVPGFTLSGTAEIGGPLPEDETAAPDPGAALQC